MTGFDNEVMNMFINYNWPGNLREFRNVIRRAVLLCNGDTITRSILPSEIINQFNHKDASNELFLNEDSSRYPMVKKDIFLKDMAAKAEYDAIMKVLKEVNYNKTKAAIILNVDRKTLYNKIKNYEGSGL